MASVQHIFEKVSYWYVQKQIQNLCTKVFQGGLIKTFSTAVFNISILLKVMITSKVTEIEYLCLFMNYFLLTSTVKVVIELNILHGFYD